MTELETRINELHAAVIENSLRCDTCNYWTFWGQRDGLCRARGQFIGATTTGMSCPLTRDDFQCSMWKMKKEMK